MSEPGDSRRVGCGRFQAHRAAGERAEIFRRGACAARHLARHRAQRDRRADRRQRRRQVDADQGDDRRARADLRPHLHPRPASSTRRTIRSAWRTTLSIETVYQDRSLADKQPLWRNFFVGRQITNRFGFIDIKREKEIADEILLKSIGFRGVGITVDSTVAQLSGGERQGIAIGRAMHYDADLIVLDEPTAALAVKEVRKVLDFVRRIKESGPRLHLHRAQPRACARGRRPAGHPRPRPGRRGGQAAGHVGRRAHRIPDRAAAEALTRMASLARTASLDRSGSKACRSSSSSRCCSLLFM